MGRCRRSTSGAVPAVNRTTPLAILGEKWGTGVRLWSISAVLLAVLAVGGVAVWRMVSEPGAAAKGLVREAPPGAELDPNRIAVMYFEKAPGSSDSLEYMAHGLTEALINELSSVKGLQVISSNGVRRSGNSDAPLQDIGRALNVGTIVHGSVAQSGDLLRVNVSLANASTGDEIGSKTMERPRGEVFALQDDLANEVAIFLRERLGHEVQLQEVRAGTTARRPGS